ncbi:MAG TPA: hypothetical protein VF625_02585 [Longimicrobium sp.]|jgi:hypothetical protein
MRHLFSRSAPVLERPSGASGPERRLAGGVARRLRGVAGTAVGWAVAWGAVGVIPSVAIQAFWFGRHQEGMVTATTLARMAGSGFAFWGAWGAISGAVFATAMMARERRRTLNDVSARRVAGWGALAGLTVPLLSLAVVAAHPPAGGVPIGMALIPMAGAVLGSLCGAGFLALARHAPQTSA